jgi:protein-S-isoprenylcysteine O-methyltransferase Ste14
MIKKRSLAAYIILTIITFGIYGLYWVHKLAKDMNTICNGDGKKTGGLLKCFFLGLITMGIYNGVWLFMLGDRLQDNAPRYGLAFKESGTAVLLWALLGSCIIVGPFISLYIIIKNINALAEKYNRQSGENAG